MKPNDNILELEKTLLKLENLHASFDYLRISIASPKRMKSWSERTLPTGEIVGEVLKPETINFRSHQPEINGLFCERIFGPIKNWKCKCGKYNGFVIDKVCEECQVEIIEARVRRYRMGYIDLTCPITHLWYFKGVPNYLAIILRHLTVTPANLEQVIYLKEGSRVVQKENPLFAFQSSHPEGKKKEETKKKENAKEENYNALEKFLLNNLNGPEINRKLKSSSILTLKPKKLKRRGSEIIKAALESIDLPKEIQKARNAMDRYAYRVISASLIQDKIFIRRIRVLESFLSTKTDPSWMVLTTLPVLPPNLRPLLELDSGRLVAADVNEIYRLIITRNQRLFDFVYQFVAPDLITVHGRKLLQEAVDSLIDNARLPKNKTFSVNNKALKSLTENLEGKQGRFRQSLLGKRVDYSGRSVIIVGPTLRLNQCGLPYEMAAELFQPFLINELLKTKIKAPSHNTKLAHVIIKKNKPFIWSLLKKLTLKHCILLNRAPTLHRFGIQAFDPVIILGQAIHLHPLVCTGFNADFDGDQMAVHLPLYESSQLEAKTMMRPSFNVLSPANGEVILKPTQDMVIGCYYLTLMISQNKYSLQKWFASEEDVLSAFYQKKITIHTPVLVRYSLLNLSCQIQNAKFSFIDSPILLNITISEKDIFIKKVFRSKKATLKYYLITNIGIFIGESLEMNKFMLKDLFLESTAGRIIFSTNFRNAIKK